LGAKLTRRGGGGGNVAETRKLPSWQVIIPPTAAVAGYYFQAINKDAPHPAAARL
jgi:putative spermidine/putrescine transport system substrate-binding protein